MLNLNQFILSLYLLTISININSQPDPPDGCVNVFLINPQVVCPTVYNPVCGCDGVTYSNECIAYNHYGVTEWTEGACENTPLCFDLQEIDFGDCQTPLGVGLIDGECTFISGCGYLVDGMDYSSYFFDNIEICLGFCGLDSTCIDFTNLDFGLCDLVLGYGMIDGTCQLISGCDYVVDQIDYSSYFFDDLESCSTQCGLVDSMCFDLSEIDFGLCTTPLGIGMIDGSCEMISGCGYLVDGIDYSPYFHNSMESCQLFCESSDCTDSSLIDPEVICNSIYAPVCGCDGVTYENECIARYGYGVTSWTEGECSTTEAPSCTDLQNIDFGDCFASLGYGLINNQCQTIAGCSYIADGVDYSAAIFETIEACTTQCLTDTLCFDFSGLDFGPCDMILGVGVIDGGCQYISGCGTYLEGVDYSSFFWINIEDCMYYCESTDCYEPENIDPEHTCPENYVPVCGCDGITYPNECIAYYSNGITEWTPGSCSSNDTLCFELENIDFGDCEINLGVGIINGACQYVSGCGYIIDNVDYSEYFYNSIESCEEWCEYTVDIKELNPLNYIVFPNPASGHVNIVFETNNHRKILIKNHLGQIVLNETRENKYIHIETKSLSTGIYFLLVQQKNKSCMIFKLMIN